jgi:DNA-directed RNA polymerase subunit E'/Rpb7
MQKTVEIKKTLCVDPSVMDSNLIRTIVVLYRKKYEKTCDENDGYIISIDGLKDLTNIISKDSQHIHFSAILTATVVKPEKGQVITFKPSLIMQKGIFGKIYDMISLFVPDEYMKEWKYKDDSFVHNDNEERKITKGEPIEAIINDIKFNSTKYNCVCTLKV